MYNQRGTGSIPARLHFDYGEDDNISTWRNAILPKPFFWLPSIYQQLLSIPTQVKRLALSFSSKVFNDFNF